LNKTQEDIIHNLGRIRQRISGACQNCGRTESEVRLLLATKTVQPDAIRYAILAGSTLVGENKVQEFTAKADALADLDYTRHFIGHLQRNKVREVLRHVHNIETIDSLSLAAEIDKQLMIIGRKLDIMIQVNTSFEKSKFGIHPDQVLDFAEEIKAFQHLRLTGLMTIGLNAATPEEARPSYRLLKELGEKINDKDPARPVIDYSMGMSNDLEVAIEEGATIVRIGSAVFGPRL